MKSVKRRFAGRLSLLLACIPVFAAFASAGKERESAGPGTHLLNAVIPDGGRIVFLPDAEIDSKEECAAYLQWAADSHGVSPSRLRAVWATDAFPVPLFPRGCSLFFREGDSASDPSGENGFVVAAAPGPDAAELFLKLRSRPVRGAASPRLCMTNVWVLTRSELFRRWEADVRTGGVEAAQAVRGEIRSLKALLEKDGDVRRPWLDGLDEFRRRTKEVWPRVCFKNESGSEIRVWIGSSEKPHDIKAGEKWEGAVKSPPRDGLIAWRARSLSDPGLTDEDVDPAKGTLEWDCLSNEDVVKKFYSVDCKTKKFPELALPPAFRDRPSGFSVEIFYEDSELPEKPEIRADGDGAAVTVAPHRRIRKVMASAPGYKSGFLKAPGGRREFSRGERIVLKGDALERLPWPKVFVQNGSDFAVDLYVNDKKEGAIGSGKSKEVSLSNGPDQDAAAVKVRVESSESDEKHEETVSLKRGGGDKELTVALKRRTSPAPVMPPAPEHPWPSSGEVEEAKSYFSIMHKACSGPRSSAPDAAEYKEEMKKIFEFWKNDGIGENHFERTFREVVAHVSACRNGCAKCGLKPGGRLFPKDAKCEAFAILGEWNDVDLEKFRSGLLVGKIDGDYVNREIKTVWWPMCRRFLRYLEEKDELSAKKEKERIDEFFNGRGQEHMGPLFKRVYIHIETCSGSACDFCVSRRNGLKHFENRPEFEDRRKALFNALVSGAEPNSINELNRFWTRWDEWNGRRR